MTKLQRYVGGVLLLGAAVGSIRCATFGWPSKCDDEIPSCPGCQLNYAGTQSTVTGTFKCLPAKYQNGKGKAQVITNVASPYMTTMPVKGVPFTSLAPMSSKPANPGSIQLWFLSPTQNWEQGDTVLMSVP